MQTAYYTTTTVLPGSRIEISAPELTEGQEVQVIVVSRAQAETTAQRRRTGPSALDIIEAYKGPGVFATAEDVDRHINEERDSWDR
jgi:hypothetical protein